MSYFIIQSLLLIFCTSLFAEEKMLSNIEQLTFEEMGFEKAGEAYFSPDGVHISFQAVPLGEKDYQIYVMNLESREIKHVSPFAKACTCSYFSPDGKKMIFAASDKNAFVAKSNSYTWDLTPYMNIYESNIDGSDVKALTQGPSYHAECAYSPDGEEIVYASNACGSMNIYTMKKDGTDVKKITHTTNCYNGGPFFSPDGSKIIFRADRETKDYLQIYMMDADGNNLEKLTENNAINWAPFWHPSGEYIAYTTSIHGHHQYQIYLLDLKTRNNFRVTDYPAFNGLPSFNKEGNKMLWTSKRGSDKTSQVFIAEFNRLYEE